jgi:hypothetical protein
VRVVWSGRYLGFGTRWGGRHCRRLNFRRALTLQQLRWYLIDSWRSIELDGNSDGEEHEHVRVSILHFFNPIPTNCLDSSG